MSTSLGSLRRIAIVVLVATLVVTVTGVGRLQLNSHYTAYFDSDDPMLVAHREIAKLYSREDAIFVVLQSSSSFLGSKNYRLLEDVTALLARQPFVTGVVSITELGIVGETPGDNGDFLPSLQQLVNETRAMGLLLSDSTQLAGIRVQMQLPDGSSHTVLRAVDTVRQSVAATIGGLPVAAHYTGTLALNEAYIKVVQHDLTRIVPLLLLVMSAVLGWLLRSVRAVLTILPVGICSVAAAFGTVGLFGAELAAIDAFVPVIVFSISLAGCVHMALSYNHYRRGGLPAGKAAVAAADYNLLPMSLANGTTVLGFLGLILTPSPPIRVMAYLLATGIAVSFLLCMTLLPVLQARFDPWNSRTEQRFTFVDRLAPLVTRHRTGVITLFVLLSLPAAWFASRNVVSDNVLEYFVPSHEFNRDTQLVDEQLSGVNEVLYSVDTGRAFGLFRADAIAAIDRLSTWLRQQPEVKRVTSVADTDVLAEAMQAGRLQQRLDFYRDRVNKAGGLNRLLAHEVSADYRSAVVGAYLRPLDSAYMLAFDRRVHSWAAKNLRDYAVRSGGPTLMFANLGEQNIRGMLTALTIALFAAALILGAVLRSTHAAWTGIVCNLLPVLLVYSVWAVTIGKISMGAAVVMGMILGIILDDTIYLLTTYRRSLQSGLPKPVGHALRRVGPALIVTTVTLMAGMSLGLWSDFRPIWSMSMLSVSIIGTALVVDLLLLPAMLPASEHPETGT